MTAGRDRGLRLVRGSGVTVDPAALEELRELQEMGERLAAEQSRLSGEVAELFEEATARRRPEVGLLARLAGKLRGLTS